MLTTYRTLILADGEVIDLDVNNAIESCGWDHRLLGSLKIKPHAELGKLVEQYAKEHNISYMLVGATCATTGTFAGHLAKFDAIIILQQKNTPYPYADIYRKHAKKMHKMIYTYIWDDQ